MTDSLRAETVRLTGHKGDEIEAYLAQPLDEGRFGSVVVIHHMPGYDEGMKEITRKFAAHGYLAVCPNLYCREAPGASPDDAAAVVRALGGVPDDVYIASGLFERISILYIASHCDGNRLAKLMRFFFMHFSLELFFY